MGPPAPLNPTGTGTPGGSGTPGVPAVPTTPVEDIYDSIPDLQERYGVDGLAGGLDFVRDAVAAGDALGLAQAAIAAGVPSSDLSTLLGLSGVDISAAEISAWAVSQGLPAFAGGGFHSGGLRLVGEKGPEIEATGAARIWNADQTRNMLGGGGDSDEEVLAALAGIQASLNNLGYEVRAVAGHTNKTARILTRVTQDGEALTTTPLV